MKIEEIKIEDVKSLSANYEYVLFYGYSDIDFGKTSGISLDWDQCSEAYFFNKAGQIHVFRDNDMLKAVRMSEENGDKHYMDRTYDITGRFGSVCNEIIVREYLSPDEDGQAVVTYTRLLSAR